MNQRTKFYLFYYLIVCAVFAAGALTAKLLFGETGLAADAPTHLRVFAGGVLTLLAIIILLAAREERR